ncbi:MAG: hypothetical protein PVH37_26055 [Desulfobacterales bacterium]|jgi:hypothetical protein
MTEKRDEIDEKYVYRFSELIVVSARLIDEGWLDLSDLEGLAEDKVDRLESLIKLLNE